MIFVGVTLCRKCDKGDAVLASSLFTCAHIHLESIEGFAGKTVAGTSLIVVVDDIDLPATSKTMILLPDLTASLKEPVPLSLRFVT